MDFYMSTWTELDIPGSAGMSLDDLRLTGERLLGYFVGSEATPRLRRLWKEHWPVFREHESNISGTCAICSGWGSRKTGMLGNGLNGSLARWMAERSPWAS